MDLVHDISVHAFTENETYSSPCLDVFDKADDEVGVEGVEEVKNEDLINERVFESS